MDALVDLIKRIGIFMIAAQAVIHFSPEQKYGKYMKLIVSIMILLQFLTPVYSIFTGLEADWGNDLLDFQTDYPADEVMGGESPSEALVNSMENEIKSKLNNEIASEDYRVVNVNVSLETLRERDENGFKQYELNNVRVVVMFPMASATETETEKIQIQKISIGERPTEEDHIADDTGEIGDVLRERFAQILGIEEKYVEVGLYGTVEETAE